MDAARHPSGTFYAGLWSATAGTRFFACPPWVCTQQAAELMAALHGLTVAAHRKDLIIHLYVDNIAALHSLLRSRAASPLRPQNRILRRVTYLLHWSAITAALHYIPSALNPADPPSRWWTYSDPAILLTSTWGLATSLRQHPPDISWGTLHGTSRCLP